MTGMNIQMVIMRNFGALLATSALLAALGQCAPAGIPQAGSASTASNKPQNALNSLLKQLQSSNAAGSSGQQQALSSAASTAASTSSPRDGATLNVDDQLNTFDGKNPFSDDSLWQIPIHLVRDSSASADSKPVRGGEPMAKSASELTSAAAEAANERDNLDAADHDDDDDSASMGSDEQRDTTSLLAHQKANLGATATAASVSTAPTVISASTDLKTAAGYHHATPHHHGYEGHHDHHDHHGAGHYGKYFQYASVPYPYAWDFGYRRGNPYHTIERYEHGKGPHFQTKVKWSDKHGGYGVHVWDYNHDDHSAHHYGHGHGDSHYDSHAPAHHYGHHAGHHAGHH